MPTRTIIVTASKVNGQVIDEPDVESFATALHEEEPTEMVVTDDHVFNLYTLHSYAKFKLTMVDDEDLGLDFERPFKIGHEVDPDDGTWLEVNDGVALIYQVIDFNSKYPGEVFYVGFKLS
jgi:hypothetical protein